MTSHHLLEVAHLHKRYASNIVLADVSFSLDRGEVLALLGENGAGKSTLIKILTGAVNPDQGTVTLDHEILHSGDTALSRQRGISVVYQELSLCPHLSVEDNILLGREHHRWGFLNRKSQRQIAADALSTLGQPIEWLDRPVQTLSVGQKQLVEIARAIAQQAKILILDEPTSSLTAEDAQHLFAVLRRLQQQGLAIIYISHFLEEVRSICSTYLVLRDGAVAGRGQLENSSQRELLRMMAGRDIEQLYPPRHSQSGKDRLHISQLSGNPLPSNISLNAKRGEILGIAGLVGAGRTEMLRCLFGLDRYISGQITLDHQTLPSTTHPRQRIQAGIAMISEDRKQEGLAQSLSITDNMTLSHLAPFSRFGWLDEKSREHAAAELQIKFFIKAASLDAPIWTLSGGNQQKVALARALHQQGTVWLLDEPTRGIDIGTKAELYRWMADLAAQGHTLIFVSSYFQELLATCDRIAVISRGNLVALRPTEQWTEQELLSTAMQGTTD